MALQQVLVASTLLMACICLSSARYQQHYDDPYYYEDQPAYYNFEWEVKDDYSGNDYRQKESRDGRLTTGLYQVLLPDGRQQTVNYRVDKDSGFMADVSYQGASNYFNFQTNYQQQQQQPQQYYKKSYEEPKVVYQQQPKYDYVPLAPHYPAATKPMTPKKYHSKPAAKPMTTTTPAPKVVYYDERPPQQHEEWSAKEPEMTLPAIKESIKSSKKDPQPVLFPLYRVDYYAAKEKSNNNKKAMSELMAKPMEEVRESVYAVDDNGSTYIKPAAAYSVPEKLGSYEVKHRKATVRKPSKSDYQAPDSLIADQ